LYSTNLTAAVSGYTTGQIYTTNQLIVSTSGASASYVNNLLVGTTGVTASVQIAANAYVTGQTNGTGGAAVASWGFNLDANGKAAGLRATTSNATQYGVLALSGLSIQSESFTPGVKGWRIDPSGNAEFGNAIVRGTFTGGTGTYKTAINEGGLTVGEGSSLFTQLGADGFIRMATPITNTVSLSTLDNAGVLGGVISLGRESSPGTPIIQLDGYDGSIFCNILDVNAISTSTISGYNLIVGNTSAFTGAATFQGQLNITSTNKLHFSNAGANVSYISEDYGMNLWGDATHPTHVRGGSLVRGNTAGGSFGTQNILNFLIDFNPDTSWADGILPNTFQCATVVGSDHAFTAYLKFRGPGGTTVYVPYQTSVP
jgi:hypothetical protein